MNACLSIRPMYTRIKWDVFEGFMAKAKKSKVIFCDGQGYNCYIKNTSYIHISRVL